MQSSYSRWWDGRTQWDRVSAVSRSFARTLWLHVPDIPITPESRETIMRKEEVIRCVHTLAVALKHHLRGEREWHECHDLKHGVDHVPNVLLLPHFRNPQLTKLPTVQPHRNKPPPNPDPPPLHRNRVLSHSWAPPNRHPSPHAPLNPYRHSNIHPLRLRTSSPHPHSPRIQHRHLENCMDFHLHVTWPAVGGTEVVECGCYGGHCVCALCLGGSGVRD